MTASPLPPGATSTPPLRSRALALLVLACLAAGGWTAAPVAARPAAPRAHAARACAPTGAIRSDRASVLRAERRVLCLINRTRMRFGLPPLRANRCLHRVAARHAHDMVARRYFAHVTPNGWDTGARAQASGYAPRRGLWIVGENIAWGVAGAASPAWVMRAWMHSPGHRANILNPRFRDAGVGIVASTPLARFNRWPRRATFSVDFGARSGASQCVVGAYRITREPRRSSARARHHRHARSARSRSPR